MDDTAYVPAEVAAERLSTSDQPQASTSNASAAATSTTAQPVSSAQEADSKPPAAEASPSVTRRPITDETTAATRIQASFRGHQARHRVTALKHPTLWPATGPLSAQGQHPPKRALKNPVYATLTVHHDSSCGCPGPNNRNTIRFEHAFPPGLIGVYTPAQWSDIIDKLNTALHTNYLPLCPTGLLFLLPIVGACVWISWQDKLRTQRRQQVEAIMQAESERLHPWGLKWLVVPIWSGNREGRGDISGFVLELVMTHIAMASARTRDAKLQQGMTRQTSTSAPPKRQVMDNGATTNNANGTNANGETKVVQVQPAPQ